MKTRDFVFQLLFMFAVFFVARNWGTLADAHPRDNCECLELRAIRRILEQQTGVACNERRCLPVATPTVPSGGPLE